MTRTATLVLGLGLALVSSAAFARPYIATPRATDAQSQTVTPMIGISNEYGFESGVKAAWVLTNHGFVPQINNAVYIEGSAFLAGLDEDQTHALIAPLLRWDFHLHPQWTVYGSAGAELDSPMGGSRDDDDQPRRERDRRTHVNLDAGGGGMFRMSDAVSLRGEIDIAHGSARAGAMFRF